MATTIVGIFDDFARAQATLNELTRMGVQQTGVSVVRNEPAGKGYTTYGGANSKDYTTGTSIGDKITGFFESLFGTDVTEEERGVYAESVRRGSTLVAVNVDESQVERVADVLTRGGAVDVDRRTAQYQSAGYKNFDAKAPLYTADQTQSELRQFAEGGEVALPVIEEQLQVGKRVVQRGAVRVHTHVIERPVEETVTLRDENVHVERRPANRQASEADFTSVGGQDLVVTEHHEVPVAAKEARVVEEVRVGTNVEERIETVRDTVRRTDVEVEQLESDVNTGRAGH